MPTISNKRRSYTATATQLFSALPQLNAQSMRIINWRDVNGIPRSYNFALGAGALTGFTIGESYEVIPITAVDNVPLVNAYGGGSGSTGQPINAGVQPAGSRTITVTGVLLDANDILLRNGAPVLPADYTRTQSGGNTIYTLNSDKPAISDVEATDPTTFQYQIVS